MTISGFGNLKNSLKLTSTSQAPKLNAEKADAELTGQTGAKPCAVWIGSSGGGAKGVPSLAEPGDVVMFDDGECLRLCIGPDGETYWAKTTVLMRDFESDRGDIRRT